MGRKIEKKTGRPPANIEDYLAKMQPFLQLGLSLYKSCVQADVPYRTVLDYYNSDDSFRQRVDRARNDMVTTSRRALYNEIQEKEWSKTDAHKYVLDNLDEDIIKKGSVNISGEKVLVIPGELIKKYQIEGADEITQNSEDSSN